MYNFGSATSHSKLSVLRICNQLLRRLSRASSSELCGRILMFLTRLLPLLDRSGLNVQGQFNTSHSTPVEDVPEVPIPRFSIVLGREILVLSMHREAALPLYFNARTLFHADTLFLLTV